MLDYFVGNSSHGVQFLEQRLKNHLVRKVQCLIPLLCLLSCSAAADAWDGIRLFAAELSAANHTTLTKSDGTGLAKITFEISTMTITWEVSHEGLTSPPTGIHLHGPAQPGTNAVQIIDLGGNGLKSPIKGSVQISDSHAQYMLLGWTYVLLKTQRYPEGELRGKLDTVPPPNFKRDGRYGQ